MPKLPPMEKSGHYTSGPKKFLGMQFTAQEWNKLMGIISQSIATQIKHEQDRAIKALKKLRNPDKEDD